MGVDAAEGNRIGGSFFSPALYLCPDRGETGTEKKRARKGSDGNGSPRKREQSHRGQGPHVEGVTDWRSLLERFSAFDRVLLASEKGGRPLNRSAAGIC